MFRQIRRILSATLASLSLLLAIASAVLWHRSYRTSDTLGDYFYRSYGDHYIQTWAWITSEHGGVSIRINTSPVAERYPYTSAHWSSRNALHYPVVERVKRTSDRYFFIKRDANITFAGFQLQHLDLRIGGPSALSDTYSNLTAPYAFWLVLFLIVPAIWLKRFRRRRMEARRLKNNLCPKCGYDLRAGHAQCPECGTINPHVSATAPEPQNM